MIVDTTTLADLQEANLEQALNQVCNCDLSQLDLNISTH